MPLVVRDKIEQWIVDLVPGRSFIDIGGIGEDSTNERCTLAVKSGATKVMMADIQPETHRYWKTFREKCEREKTKGVVEFSGIDVRKRETLMRIGVADVVHSTGIFYHLASPAEACWNLRRITGKYFITNTVTFPSRVENKFGSIELPACGILFGAALTEQDRLVLNEHYRSMFGWTTDTAMPRLSEPKQVNPWIVGGELTPWPYWYLYSDHAFRCLIQLCRFRILDEVKWENHALFLLCEKCDLD